MLEEFFNSDFEDHISHNLLMESWNWVQVTIRIKDCVEDILGDKVGSG